MNQKIWKVCDFNPRLQQVLSSELGISAIFAQLLVNRGIRTPEQAQMFLFGDISSCADSFRMKDMLRAVKRIKKAVETKEKILIYGDYDVDGLTSAALLSEILGYMGAKYETFIPNRLEEGYGLDVNAVKQFAAKGISLIITVDCGINSVDEIECANSFGIEVIVTDHHEIRGERPDAYAMINPHQSDCDYPFEQLAGVGVVYKLARALMEGKEDAVDKHLDLVALGTVADIVPLIGENRVLAKNGLKCLRRTRKPGLQALMDVAGVDPEKLGFRHIGFALAPRINAMGRIGSAEIALELLMCRDPDRACYLAKVLDKENKNRQNIEKKVLEHALKKTETELDLQKEKIIVLAEENWHVGVIGIVASRLTEEYKRPAILISLDGDKGKGSGRGVKGFNLFEAVSRAGDHLINFGGHKAACGIRIERDKVDMFRQSLNSAQYFERDDMTPELMVDFNVPFSYVGPKLINELENLMPYGPGNNEPVFSTTGIIVKNTPRNIGKNGYKFLTKCGNLTYEAITFKKNEFLRPKAGDTINLAYTPSINTWGGYDSIQLNIRDLHIC
ncbi:MAG: single-stranded-DNA-specific exonuclease RecJ [Candidatus Omnitrophota bacterium]